MLQNLPNRVARDGLVIYHPGFLAANAASSWLVRLLDELDFADEWLRIAGRRIRVPRRVGWYGEPGIRYRYSGATHEAAPWTPGLAELRDQLSWICDCPFNSVLGNLYETGQDSIGWHADNEPELGPEPTIASLSLGGVRRFRLRHLGDGEVVNIDLEPGSLLLMGGSLQRHWRHCLPKTRRARGLRMNLTFRYILPDLTR